MNVLVTLLVTGVLSASASGETMRIVAGRSEPVTLTIELREASLSRALGVVAMHLGKPVEIRAADRKVTLEARGIGPAAAVSAIAAAAGLEAVETTRAWTVRDPGDPTVTLDVQDGDARAILRELARQCGVRNLMIDPEVAGRGTFLLREVPCRLALPIVLDSLGLAGEIHPSSVVRVKGK
ncbi:MAG TPA: hypothetical protein VMS56_03255 [Thermoanaerobaculia bacterium]|nr:hypothetical protein [Thermoanaerobaculia bacterium]